MCQTVAAGPSQMSPRCSCEEGESLPCSQADPDKWFAESPQGVEEAKAECQRCPVRELCLREALERAEPWGVWGGELVLSGEVVARKRPRGRPRKHPLVAVQGQAAHLG